MLDWILYGLIALAGSVVSSMMALGAVLITTPLFDLVPGQNITFHQVGYLNLILVLTGAVVAAITHHRAGHVDVGFVRRVAPVSALGALAGGLLASLVSESALRVIFIVVAIGSLVLGLAPRGGRFSRVARRAIGLDPAERGLGDRTWPFLIAVALVTVTAGLVGVGGGLLLTPLLLKVVRLEPKAAVGSMMIIGITTTASALVGRIGTTPPPWEAIIAVIVGAGIGGWIGARVVRRLPDRVIVPLISIVVVLSAGQTLAGELIR